MSIERMATVWEQSQHKGNALLLLLKLADNANDDGYCWPGIEHLAERTKVTPQTIIRLTRELEQSGELFVYHNRRTGNRYIVRIGLPDEAIVKVLVDKFNFTEEEITNILLYNTCVTSELTPNEQKLQNITSEVTHVLEEPSRTVNKKPSETIKSAGAEICPTCKKPNLTGPNAPAIRDCCICAGEAALEEVFGPRPERERGNGGRPGPGDKERPWLDWSDGRFRERDGVSAEAQDRVAWLVEHYGGLRPAGSSYTGWANGAIGTYNAGRGDWAVIECGIMRAFNREPQYRPTTLACSKKTVDQNGIVKAVAGEWSARNMPSSRASSGVSGADRWLRQSREAGLI